jgi:hypothetical protein
MTRAEAALADFLEASEQMDYARQLITSYEGHQQRALASLIDAIGRDQAADLTGVDERQIRAALAVARTPANEAKREGDVQDDTDTTETDPPTVPHTEPEPVAQAG